MDWIGPYLQDIINFLLIITIMIQGKRINALRSDTAAFRKDTLRICRVFSEDILAIREKIDG